MATLPSKRTPSRRRSPAKSSGAKPAEIRLTVTAFRDILTSEGKGPERGTGFTLALRQKHPRVQLKGDTLFIAPPGVTLRFTLAAAPGDKENYFPMGITYVRTSDKVDRDEQRLGLVNFPQKRQQLAGRTITVVDSYRDGRKPVAYKFSIIVQRGSDGQIGLIDPQMIHDNSDGIGR